MARTTACFVRSEKKAHDTAATTVDTLQFTIRRIAPHGNFDLVFAMSERRGDPAVKKAPKTGLHPLSPRTSRGVNP
jgi:hypothetical protein